MLPKTNKYAGRIGRQGRGKRSISTGVRLETAKTTTISVTGRVMNQERCFTDYVPD